MGIETLVPGIVLAGVLLSDAWVARDAALRHHQGTDVVATVGPVTIERPGEWLLACLVLWIVAFPLYLAARRAG